ncbi:hypothetical protein EV715DRAFT_215231, partial [Schizophyllum commune]
KIRLRCGFRLSLLEVHHAPPPLLPWPRSHVLELGKDPIERHAKLQSPRRKASTSATTRMTGSSHGYDSNEREHGSRPPTRIPPCVIALITLRID